MLISAEKTDILYLLVRNTTSKGLPALWTLLWLRNVFLRKPGVKTTDTTSRNASFPIILIRPVLTVRNIIKPVKQTTFGLAKKKDILWSAIREKFGTATKFDLMTTLLQNAFATHVSDLTTQ